MTLKYTTPVPNIFFDSHLPTISYSVLKVLLVVIRQTYGWVDRRTGGRKKKDRITQYQFMQKTGLSRKAVSGAISSLVKKELIHLSDVHGHSLTDPGERKGVHKIYYACVLQRRGGVVETKVDERVYYRKY